MHKKIPTQIPTSSPLLRTVAMPANMNSGGKGFGGWIVSQMDLAASITARQVSQGSVVTVAMDSIRFWTPVEVGNIINCYATNLETSASLIKVQVEIWIDKIVDGEQNKFFCAADGILTFSAINAAGKPRRIK